MYTIAGKKELIMKPYFFKIVAVLTLTQRRKLNIYK